ncbi:MAG TPA: riboflavin synthase [Dehalococcoidia bacterium]|jgi:riboflavin synthase|nr:riboflavin synthase [Dehalococcoidia bacterium]|tara:strand:- start:336 stop:905 length:570 start_codon:yes stop_codon:yes gene_type:complete
MFTGIIEEVGTVHQLEDNELVIQCSLVLDDAHVGDSISTNGICLTITKFTKEGFSVDVSPETLERTNVHALKNGDKINLERAMSVSSRFGGHYVQGHIDTTGNVTSITAQDDSFFITIDYPSSYNKFIVEKGYVAVNGISLTVTKCTPTSFTICVIPYSFTHTNLDSLTIGTTVNLEVDILAKYVMNAT